MTRSAWLLPALTIALFAATVLLPAAGVIHILSEPETSGVEIRSLGALFWTTVTWSALAAAGAALLGWLPGRVLTRARRSSRGLAFIAFVLVPVCLPAYIVFYAWWQGWPAGSLLYRWAVEQEMIVTLRHLTLLISFWCWAWPLVALCVMGAHDPATDAEEELLEIDGISGVRLWIHRLRNDMRGLVFGFVVVFLITFNNTTCFDLCEIFTFGNELRAIRAIGATRYEATLAAWPAVLLSLAGCVVIWLFLSRIRRPEGVRTPRLGSSLVLAAAILWIASWGIPFAILFGNGAWIGEVASFGRLYGSITGRSLALAAGGGVMVMLVAAGFTFAWQDSRAWVRRLFTAQAIGWIIAAALPGTLIGLALEAGYNRPVLNAIYSSPMILVFAYASRFAFIGALFGRWAVVREPTNLRDLRLVDGQTTLLPLLRALWPRLVAACGASALIVAVMSFGEIPVTAAVHPPGSDPLALSLLNAMHYQRPETVTIAALLLIVLALAVALVILGMTARFRSRDTVRVANGLLIALLIVLPGCEDNLEEAPLDTRFTFGSPGRSLGQFSYPRGIAADPQGGYIYVVDKTARVQRYDLQGEPQLYWDMPAKEYGKPTGLHVAPDGRVFVADTHYWRVIAYDREGNELMQFGSYGEEEGQFIYPTDIAFGPDGMIYVAEYGGNDRIQVFDSEGGFLFAFGSPGTGSGEFTRPQSIAFSHDLRELYITDSCNHRIIVTDPQGTVLRTFGQPGRGPGQLQFPYDLAVLSDGSLLVCEFGGNRLQRFSPDGGFLGLYGQLGMGEGELQYPWGVDVANDMVFVLDSGNNRVQVIDEPAD